MIEKYEQVCKKLEGLNVTTSEEMSQQYKEIYIDFEDDERICLIPTSLEWKSLLHAYLYANNFRMANPERVIENMYRKIYDNEQTIQILN